MSTSGSTDLTTLLRQQESLRGIIESISSELELRPLLTLIVRHACELLGAENGTMGLIDEQRHVVTTEAVYQMPENELGCEFPSGVGLFGHILLHQKPLILKRYDAVEQPTQPGLLDYSVLGLPILWRNQMIGVFGLGSPPPRQFTEQEAEILSLFAKHAAIAIVNARLFESERRRTARSAIINQVSWQINSSLSLDAILQTAVASINQHLGYPNVALLLVDPEEPRTLVLKASSGFYIENMFSAYRQSIDVGIIGAAARSQQPVLIADVRRDLRYLLVPGADDILSELAMPLVVGERLLGVLNVESKQTITTDNVTDLKIVADQLGVAIDNAHHYAEEKRRTERLELIARVGQRIAARLDPDELFSATIKEIYTQLGYDHVAFFLVDQANPQWLIQRSFASRWRHAGRVGYRQSIDQGIIGTAARQHKPELVNDVAADTRYVPVAESADLRAELAVPILLGERLLGVFDVASRKPFHDDDIKAIQIITDQLAVAIDHAYLFADTQRTLNETRLLYRTSQRISVAIDVNDVVQAYLEQVATRGRYACNIALYEFDETGQRTGVIVRGRWTPAEGIQCPLMVPVPNVRDGLDPALDSGQTITIANAYTDAILPTELRQLQERDGRPALAMIPLMVRKRRIGLVILSYPAVHEWPEVDLHPYQITAAQLATAIDSRQQISLLARHDQELAVWEERRRLARELHDSVTQLLFSMTLIAQAIGPAWRRSPTEGEQRVQRLLELSQSALDEMRALLAELRPPESSSHLLSSLPGLLQVQQYGLAGALRQHVANVGRDGLKIELDTKNYLRESAAHEATLFRIAQEALNNIVKHAQASCVVIKLTTQHHGSCLTVKDNGVGFILSTVHPPTAAASKQQNAGIGLQTMCERAEALGGQFNIITGPGEGTIIEVVLPI